MSEANIQWFVPCTYENHSKWLACGPWMFARSHSGYHRTEYGWWLEFRCNCRIYFKPPTPALSIYEDSENPRTYMEQL